MSINRQTDVIRTDNRDYVNINSNNRFIKQLISSIHEDIYSFGIAFKSASKETAEEMKGTYWMNVSSSNHYDEDVQIVEL